MIALLSSGGVTYRSAPPTGGLSCVKQNARLNTSAAAFLFDDGNGHRTESNNATLGSYHTCQRARREVNGYRSHTTAATEAGRRKKKQLTYSYLLMIYTLAISTENNLFGLTFRLSVNHSCPGGPNIRVHSPYDASIPRLISQGSSSIFWCWGRGREGRPLVTAVMVYHRWIDNVVDEQKHFCFFSLAAWSNFNNNSATDTTEGPCRALERFVGRWISN